MEEWLIAAMRSVPLVIDVSQTTTDDDTPPRRSFQANSNCRLRLRPIVKHTGRPICKSEVEQSPAKPFDSHTRRQYRLTSN
jgi:hypothetical protein